MRKWNIQREVPPYITLSADYRLSTPSFYNDHTWELRMDGNEPPAVAIQTTYGLRAHRMRLFPRFVFQNKGDGLSDPRKFYRPPSLTRFFPNYLSLYFTPFPGIDVQAEYWVPSSDCICGRSVFTNRSKTTESLRFELAGILNPINFGGGLSTDFVDGVHLLKGNLDTLNPVCVMDLCDGSSNSPFTSLNQDIELFPGNFQVVHWALASLPDYQDSLQQALELTQKSWDAEISKIEIINTAQSIEIFTGDAVWDEVFSTSQKYAYGLIFNNEENRSIPPFVLSRTPDQGYSQKGDGGDYPTSWNGPTAIDAYYLFTILLPAGIDTCRQILAAFIKADKDGFINWKACNTNPQEKILSQPLLATLSLLICQYDENPDWIKEYFPILKDFFLLWLSPEYDQDQDSFPEWVHPYQSGFGESPIYDLWHSNSQNVSIHTLETPSLLAMLIRECHSLITICEMLDYKDDKKSLQAVLDRLEKNLADCWNPDLSRYQYRDYLNHQSPQGQLIGHFSNGANPINLDFPAPTRLVVSFNSIEQETAPLTITITGKKKNSACSENITIKDFIRSVNASVYTTHHDFTHITKLTIEGLVENNTLTIQSVNYQQSDISLYTPLWAGANIPQPDKTRMISSLKKEYMQTHGFPVAPENAPYIPIYWVNLIGEGLINSGENHLAVDLVSRIMDSMAQNLQKYGALFEKINAYNGSPLGEKYKLNALAPVGLFLKTLGIEKLTTTSIILNGNNPYPWPVTIKFRNLSLTIHHQDATIAFSNGQVVNVTGKGPHHITIE